METHNVVGPNRTRRRQRSKRGKEREREREREKESPTDGTIKSERMGWVEESLPPPSPLPPWEVSLGYPPLLLSNCNVIGEVSRNF